jgi:hypothetical protein
VQRFRRRQFLASASLAALAAATPWPSRRWTAVAATPGTLRPRPVDLTPQGTIRDAATLTAIRNQITASRREDTVRIAGGSYSTGVSYLTNTNNLVVDGSGPAGTAKLTGSAGFKNAADQDYRLAAGSRALRSGTSTGAPAVDLFGAPRGGAVDRGAIQGAF